MSTLSEDAPIASWAADVLAVNADEVLQALERGFPVRLISSFDLRTCNADSALHEVLADPALQSFDHIPVVAGNRIVGLLNRQELVSSADRNDNNNDQLVRAAMQPVGDSILISADASILSFIEAANDSPCRLVLDRTRIGGIVTISDLQQLPVRPVLFLLITHLELLMARIIRQRGIPESEWLKWLKADRVGSIEEKWAKLSREELGIDRLTATEFCDKREILGQAVDLGLSRSRFNAELSRIEWLRNSVAHAGDYAQTRDNARKTVQAVGLCRQWIGHLFSILTNATAASGSDASA